MSLQAVDLCIFAVEEYLLVASGRVAFLLSPALGREWRNFGAKHTIVNERLLTISFKLNSRVYHFTSVYIPPSSRPLERIATFDLLSAHVQHFPTSHVQV